MIRDKETKNFCIRDVTFKCLIPNKHNKRLVEFQICTPKMYIAYH